MENINHMRITPLYLYFLNQVEMFYLSICLLGTPKMSLELKGKILILCKLYNLLPPLQHVCES